MTMKITPAQCRALEAVRDGKCFRRYTATGNSVKGPEGIGGAALWNLEKFHLIREDGHSAGTKCLFELTDAGRMALRQAEEQQ